MRLRQAFFGVFGRYSLPLRAFASRRQGFLVAINHVTTVPFYACRPICNRKIGFNLKSTRRPSSLSLAQVSSHTCFPFTQNSVWFFPTRKHPFTLTMAKSLTSRSENGCLVVEEERKEDNVSLVETTEPQDRAIEMSETETATCMDTGTDQEHRQGMVGSDTADKKMEEGPQEEVSETNDRSSTSLKTNPASSGKIKPGDGAKVSQMSKRAQKKMLRKEKLKEQRKAKRAAHFTSNSSPGFDSDLFSQTDYYFENGLRKVYPYHYTFSTYAKERWYGRTLQEVFEQEFRVDSPDNFRTSVAKGFMRVNGKVATLDQLIQNGDLIEHDIHRHENPVSGTPIEILEDNDDVVVINKPASIPCHPCGKFRFNSIVFIMGKELGYANLRNIYRLDRLTSGVLIMGKTARKTKELENHVLHRRVHKEYVARVVGKFPEGEVTVDKPLDCLSHKLTLWRVVQKGGKPSRTTFHRLSYNGQTSVVKCVPHTGRTHQIRVHLQYLGHPIVNDPYYNSPAWGPQRGKGGHYDVSFEELCQRIMKEHNVGLWLEGENPLFEQRLAETRQSHQPSLTTEGSTPSSGTCRSTDTPATTEAEKGEEQCSSEHTPEGTPPAKKLRLEPPLSPSPSLESKDIADDSTLPPSSTPLSSVFRSPIPQIPASETSQNQRSETCANTDSVPDTGVSSVLETNASCAMNSKKNSVVESEGPAPEKNCLESVAPNLTGSGGRVVERREFEHERWVPDAHCESCRLKYIDPKPSDLLLYLHALRYKGPGWEYSTQLPQWAADDWQEPEDYSKYLQ